MLKKTGGLFVGPRDSEHGVCQVRFSDQRNKSREQILASITGTSQYKHAEKKKVLNNLV